MEVDEDISERQNGENQPSVRKEFSLADNFSFPHSSIRVELSNRTRKFLKSQTGEKLVALTVIVTRVRSVVPISVTLTKLPAGRDLRGKEDAWVCNFADCAKTSS